MKSLTFMIALSLFTVIKFLDLFLLPVFVFSGAIVLIEAIVLYVSNKWIFLLFIVFYLLVVTLMAYDMYYLGVGRIDVRLAFNLARHVLCFPCLSNGNSEIKLKLKGKQVFYWRTRSFSTTKFNTSIKDCLVMMSSNC